MSRMSTMIIYAVTRNSRLNKCYPTDHNPFRSYSLMIYFALSQIDRKISKIA